MIKFTDDEINLICIYDVKSKAKLIGELQGALPYVTDNELKLIIEQVLSKLNSITDEEFAQIDFVPMIGGDDIE